MEDRTQQAELSADRTFGAAVEAWNDGKYATAAALLRATARYLEAIGERHEAAETVVVAFPRVGTGASQGGFGGVLAPAFIAGLEGQR